MSDLRSPTLARSAARRWFVRLLDDEVTPEEIAQWQSWLAADPAHSEAFERVKAVWDLGGEAATDDVRPGAAERAADRYDGSVPVAQLRAPQPARGTPWRAPPLRIAASIAIVALVFGGWRMQTPTTVDAADLLATQRAEHRSADLADGSRVQLGALTGVQVQLTDAERTVRLPRGQAFFVVAPDKQRPFVVRTPLGTVTAVGTQFDVDVGPDLLSVTVTEGTVVLDPRRSSWWARMLHGAVDPVRITANQRLLVDLSGASPAYVVQSVGDAIPWQSRRLEYRNEPLRAVVADINRYAEHPVIVRDAELNRLGYTGTVQLGAIEQWLQGLPLAFPIQIVRGEDGVVVLTRKS